MRKNLPGLLIILTGIIVLLNSCGTPAVFRLEPQQETAFYYQGMNYTQSAEDSLWVTIAYYKHGDKYIIFDIEVANRTDQVVRVDPAKISYKAEWDPGPVIGPDPEGMKTVQGKAADPENRLIEIDRSIAEEKRQQRLDEGAHFALYSLGLAAHISADSPREKRAVAHQQEDLHYHHARDQYEHEARIRSYNNIRDKWSLGALRISDLRPDEYIQGRIYIPKHPKADYYSLKIPLNGKDHSFDYSQKIIR